MYYIDIYKSNKHMFEVDKKHKYKNIILINRLNI